LRQKVICGSPVATCAIMGPIVSCSAAKKRWKLSGRSATDQLASDVQELRSKADLIPRPGRERLRGEAEAETRGAAAAAHRAGGDLQDLRGARTADAQPAVDPKREALDREELREDSKAAVQERAAKPKP
jgi:outer membrane murein-binding lipoprotein Lpp